LRKRFNVGTNFFGLVQGRATYIVDQTGIVRHIFNSQIDIDGHVETALKILRRLKLETRPDATQ
jgi:peroxiredoxin Q/BCP